MADHQGIAPHLGQRSAHTPGASGKHEPSNLSHPFTAHGHYNVSTQPRGCRNSLPRVQRVRCFPPSHFRFGLHSPTSLCQEAQPHSQPPFAAGFLPDRSRRRTAPWFFAPRLSPATQNAPKAFFLFAPPRARTTVPAKRKSNALPIARLTRAKYSPFLASLLPCLSPHQNLTAPAPCRRAHGDSRHPTP